MATAVRDSTLVAGGSGTGTNCDTPSGTTAGDIVLVFSHINNNPTWVDNNGANALTKDIAYQPGGNAALHSWSMRPSSGNISGWGGTPDFTAGSSTRWAQAMVAVSDPDPSVIFDVTPSTGDGQADTAGLTTTVTVSSLTATTDCLLFILIGGDGNTTTIVTTDMASQGFTVLENGGNQALCLLVKDVSAGATGSFSFTGAFALPNQWASMPFLVRKNVVVSTGSGGSSSPAQTAAGKGVSIATGFGVTTAAGQATAGKGASIAAGKGGTAAGGQMTAGKGAAVATGSGGSTDGAQVTAGTGLGNGESTGKGGSTSAVQATAGKGVSVAAGSGGSSSAGQATAGKGAAVATGSGGSSSPAQGTAGKGGAEATGSGGSTAPAQETRGYNPGALAALGQGGIGRLRRKWGRRP